MRSWKEITPADVTGSAIRHERNEQTNKTAQKETKETNKPGSKQTNHAEIRQKEDFGEAMCNTDSS